MVAVAAVVVAVVVEAAVELPQQNGAQETSHNSATEKKGAEGRALGEVGEEAEYTPMVVVVEVVVVVVVVAAGVVVVVVEMVVVVVVGYVVVGCVHVCVCMEGKSGGI